MNKQGKSALDLASQQQQGLFHQEKQNNYHRQHHISRLLQTTKQQQKDKDKQKKEEENSTEQLDTTANLTLNQMPPSTTPDSFLYYQLLGRGSYGEVYLAEKKTFLSSGDKITVSRKIKGKNNTPKYKFYAVKVQDKPKGSDKKMQQQLLNERDIMVKINHPFISKLYFAFQTSNKLFLAMDYYAGGDLRKLLKKKKKLPENVAKFYLCEIVLALEALHKAKIIYRDLKPENVLLCADGHCLLIDFNLATQNKERSNSVCGTYNYLAPEMLERSGHSFSMDWYMLGVIMYELLEGTTPYYNPDRQTLYSNIRGGCLMIPKHLKEETKGLLRALLCRTPANRLGFHGSASVKAHPFFANVNWDLVYQKKISAPITTTCEIDKTPISPDFLNQNHKQNIPALDKWTFEHQDEIKIIQN